MVKNKTGGNKHKSMARKSFVTNSYNASLRKSESEDEVYALVVKILGGAMCQVNCLEKGSIVTRLCIIRNKFRGKSKRDNTIGINTPVLVGIRSWETLKEGKAEKCDLLEVYSESNYERLKTSVNENWNLLKPLKLNEDDNDANNDIVFTNNIINSELEEEINNKTENDIFTIDEEIDIDDI